MMKRPTCIEISESFELWGEYFDPHATMTAAEFEQQSAADRLALLHEYCPIDDCNCGWAETQSAQRAVDKLPALARLAAASGVTHKGTEVRIWQRGRINKPRAIATVSFYPDANNPTVDLKLESIPVTTAETIMALVGQLCDKGER